MISSFRLDILIDVAVGAYGVQVNTAFLLQNTCRVNNDRKKCTGTYRSAGMLKRAEECEETTEDGLTEVLSFTVRHCELYCDLELLLFAGHRFLHEW